MVSNSSPAYLRLSDGAILGAPEAASAAAGTVTGGQGNLVPNALLAGVPLANQHAAAAEGAEDCEYVKHERACHARGAHDPTVERSAADAGDALTRHGRDTDATRDGDADGRTTSTVMTRKSMRRRTAVTVAAIVVTVGVLGGKLVDIQVVRADELQRESVNAKSYSQPLYGIRGDIVDEAGNTLAGQRLAVHGGTVAVRCERGGEAGWAGHR